jgi:signal peptidase II
MELGESISIIGDFFRLTYVTNTGAAFSLSFGDGLFNRIFFLTIPVIAIIILIILMTKTKQSTLSHLSFALILGGAVGNYIDRIVHGSVIDFLDFDFMDVIIERWPVFNVADSAVVIAFILLFTEILVLDPLQARKGKNVREPQVSSKDVINK